MVFWVSLSKFTTPENSRFLFSLWTTSKAITSINSALKKKKERNLATCDYTDGPERHYAKWDKSITEGQTPHDSTYMRYIK